MALAVASPERSAAVPQIPTFAEVGLEAVNDPSWFGLVAPANLPADVLETLNSAVVKVLGRDDVKERLASLGASPIGDTPEQFRQTILDTLERNARIAKEAGIELN